MEVLTAGEALFLWQRAVVLISRPDCLRNCDGDREPRCFNGNVRRALFETVMVIVNRDASMATLGGRFKG